MTQKTYNDRLDYDRLPPRYRVEAGILAEAGPAVIAHAWADFKVHNDPPGLQVWQTIARQGRIAQGVWVFSLAGAAEGIDWYTTPAEARAAAWTWHDDRHALSRALDDGVWCPECGSDDAHVEAIDDKTCTQPWCVECDVEMGGMFDDLWPRCLAWSAAEVAEVERWRRDSTAEMPAVLHAPDDAEDA